MGQCSTVGCTFTPGGTWQQIVEHYYLGSTPETLAPDPGEASRGHRSPSPRTTATTLIVTSGDDYRSIDGRWFAGGQYVLMPHAGGGRWALSSGASLRRTDLEHLRPPGVEDPEAVPGAELGSCSSRPPPAAAMAMQLCQVGGNLRCGATSRACTTRTAHPAPSTSCR